MILGQEHDDTEQIINRQNAKLEYLQQENEQLTSDLEDLRKAFEMNKQALKFNVSKNYSSQQLSFSKNQISNEQIQDNDIIERLNQESKILQDTLARTVNERNQSNRKILLQQQVQQETEIFHQEVIQDLEDKILELRRIIQDKEFTIQQLERKLKLPDKDNLVYKIKEIISPNEQSISLNNQIESLREMTNRLNLDNQKLYAENKNLLNQNTNLKHELIKMKTVINNPYNFFTIKFFLTNDDKSKEDYDMQVYKSYITEQMKQYLLDVEQNKQQQLKSKEKAISQLNESLKTAQSIAKSTKNPQSRGELIEKIAVLEGEVQMQKKITYKLNFNNQILQGKTKESTIQIKDLCQTNEKLINSNKQLSEKLNVFSNQIKVLQLFIKSITQKKSYLRKYTQAYSDLETLKQIKEPNQMLISDELHYNQDQSQGPITKKKVSTQDIMQNSIKQSMKSILSPNRDELDTQLDVNKYQCIQLLRFLHTELNIKMKKKIIFISNNLNSKKSISRLYRSLSNPFDYYNVNLNQKFSGFTIKPKGFTLQNTSNDISKQNQILDIENNKQQQQQFFGDVSAIDMINMFKSNFNGIQQQQQQQQQHQNYQQRPSIPNNNKILKKSSIEDPSFISNEGGEI